MSRCRRRPSASATSITAGNNGPLFSLPEKRRDPATDGGDCITPRKTEYFPSELHTGRAAEGKIRKKGKKSGERDGARTRNNQNHNLGLYH